MLNIFIRVSILCIWSVNIFESAFLIKEESVLGTLNNIITSPYSMQVTFFSQVLINVVLNLVSVITVIAVGYIISPFTIDMNFLGYYILAYILCVLSIATIGLLISITLLYTRAARGIMNILGYPFYILSGLFMPIETLPESIRCLSYLLPTTYAIKLLDSLETSTNLVISYSIKCLILIIIFHIIINVLMRMTSKKIVTKGNLDKF